MSMTPSGTEMLEMSRQLNPECDHRSGDMRSVRLGRNFDAVFVPDAADYMLGQSDLLRAIDGDAGRGVRYLAWSWDPDAEDGLVLTDYAFCSETLTVSFGRRTRPTAPASPAARTGSAPQRSRVRARSRHAR